MSLNYETPITSKHLVSFGIGWNNMAEPKLFGDQSTFPFALFHAQYVYLISAGQAFFEIGGGFTYSIIQTDRMCRTAILNDCPFSLDLLIGYRRQVLNDFTFRAGFMPSSKVPDTCWPIVGVSFGYRL